MTSPVPTPPSGSPLDRRRAGVLLHVTSLPDGDLGSGAYAFVDLLAAAGVTVWQVLPLVPTHREERSPYNSLSVMAGNPDLVSAERAREQGLTDAAALDATSREDYHAWCAEQHDWLKAYVEFTALRETQEGLPWPLWPAGLRDRDPRAMVEALTPVGDRLGALRFEQWVFARQWADLLAYAGERGVLLFGDLPIFVSHDSADVWASRELFLLDEEGNPTTVTGVPPDYFAADGQKWNNPHYDWERMAADGFAWWRARIAAQRRLFDLVRIDHFRGFESAWHVPAEAETAVEGEWVVGPGRDVLSALEEVAGVGTLVAEDLGVITPEVEALRDQAGLPGMKVLQFAFDGDPENGYLPEHHGEHTVVYTGTHDNDTTLGWWQEQVRVVRAQVRRALVVPEEEMPWALVRLAMSSTARLAVVPAQDLLGLGHGARMNTPGTATGNWGWRAETGALDEGLAARLRALVEESDRLVE